MKIDIFVVLVIAAFLGLIPASIAQKKGHSFVLWWFYGWMLFIVAIIHVNFIDDISNVNNPNNEFRDRDNNSVVHNTVSVTEELRELKELQNQNIITNEEFEAKKKQLLGL